MTSSLLALAALLLSANSLHAQRSIPVAVQSNPAASDTIADSLEHPPISPRRAMVYSLLLPGYAQSRLNRPTASIMFAVGEVLSLGMARKAAMDLREARSARSDSIPTGFSADTVTGVIKATGYTQNRLVARIGARRTHYEDWLAAIIFNHIISGVDAYVAANLWDFNATLGVTPTRNGTAVGASLNF
ncbi:MAG: DUF5683 domain-containing protein [Gemmatimonadaceae bacterium]